MITFQWDRNKESNNIRKHGVSFMEAQTCFLDSYARLIADPGHSLDEERFVLLGMSVKFRVLVVPHVYDPERERIRIISARKANKSEAKQYREFKP